MDNLQTAGDMLARSETLLRKVSKNLRRLTAVLTGRRGGQVGEQIVGELLKAMPEDWLERNARLGNRQIEFAIKMPSIYLIPLDSKFVAPELVMQLENNDIPQGHQQLLGRVKREVQRRSQQITVVNNQRHSALQRVAVTINLLRRLTQGELALPAEEAQQTFEAPSQTSEEASPSMPEA